MPVSCGGSSGRPAYISLNVTTATTQGENEAAAAATKALSYGLPSGSTIYFDLEAFTNHSGSGCLAAAQNFVNGWAYQTYYHTAFYAGLYGSSCASFLSDMASHSSVPSAIAPSDNNHSPTGVYGLSCLPDGMWSLHQRIHQTTHTVHKQFNGDWLYVDEDCADGPVIRDTAGQSAIACTALY